MENRIDAVLATADRERVLQLVAQIRDLLPFLIDLTPEQRRTLFKMGESGRPFVEAGLTMVEQDDSYMPRSFDRTEMRKDSDLYAALLPVYTALASLFDAVDDTLMLVGSDLILAGLDVYRNAKDNGKGGNLDPLVPLLGRRFKRGKSGGDDGDGGENTPK